MRPVDLARPYGLSGQAIRNYEAAGVLPAAERTRSGYRNYTAEHASALRTFLALVPAHGHAVARSIMALVNDGRADEALVVVDRSHAELLADRQALDAIEQALTALTGSDRRDQRSSTIAAVAHRLELRPATLRRWERAGLLRPDRDPATGYRVYGPDDVRDAHIVAQLRRSGYLLAQIVPLLDELRNANSSASVASALVDRRARLHDRARAMLHAAAELGRHLDGLT
ncbi:MerR family transcriptional regulator [Pseudonocardia sp. MH-G8]|uniref:MerR family transcriptional regulator n=1 Tax=Pseudonocardia sp. MH-G8 TaxID=1854588 RepID=UPI000B9FBF29|nr:MerR family transcriptional regulator [Pseudonocardia sp. MH-G8]OZM82131.1 MerR family transcriptional regulator [Pseudonocardia sp. MH-G8]